MRHWERDIYSGDYDIPPRHTTRASVHVWIRPPVCQVGQNFVATVVLTDQYGNRHRVRHVRFTGPTLRTRDPEPARELVRDLTEPVVQKVAAVLKAEAYCYRSCGRSCGGLGSIRTTFGPGTPFHGRTLPGFGTDVRGSNSAENQPIAINPEATTITIESDNADALLGLYDSLTTDPDRELFVSALLERLGRGTEYTSISYFVLFVLFKVGRFPEALRMVKGTLRDDEGHALLDCLSVIDGLLRFKHPDFSAELLDEVEGFIHGLKNCQRIDERIQAIRAIRLAEYR